MTSTAPHFVALIRHPESYSRVLSNLDAAICWTVRSSLAITYKLHCEIANLRLPTPKFPLRADQLWKHTCLEAFIAVPGSPVYHEFNFSPSGEWAVYSFKRYRDGVVLGDDDFHPEITAHGTRNYFEINAVIRLDRLTAIQPLAVMRLGLSAVIEDIEGRLSYWALKHPPGKPDFHHPDAFALELEVPG